MNKKKILYIDMDGVIVDFDSAVKKLDKLTYEKYLRRYDEVPNIFRTMEPMPDAIDSVKTLSKIYDLYILSSASWSNDSSWSDKIWWLKKYFGDDERSPLYKRLILTHRKNLVRGDILIDDRTKNGAQEFDGEFIQFGVGEYTDWPKVMRKLI